MAAEERGAGGGPGSEEEAAGRRCGVCQCPCTGEDQQETYIEGEPRDQPEDPRACLLSAPAPPLRSGPLRRRLLSCPPHFPLCAALTAAALCNKCGELSFHVDCVVPIMSKIHHDSTRSMDRARVRGGAPGGSATNLSSSGAAVDWWAAQQWPNL